MKSKLNFFLNDEELFAEEGMSVAAALLLNSQRITRTTRIHQQPRGIFCGIGICFDCLVMIDGVNNQRACLIEISSGMRIETQSGAGSFSEAGDS